MSEIFFKRPTISLADVVSTRHWQCGSAAQPIGRLIAARGKWPLNMSVSKLLMRRGRTGDSDCRLPRMLFDAGDENGSTKEQEQIPHRIITEILSRVLACFRLQTGWSAAR